MEKVMTVMLAMLMFLQAGAMQKNAFSPNGLAVLREAAAQSELQIDGVVLEAWAPKAGDKAVQELAQALGAAEIASGGEQTLETGCLLYTSYRPYCRSTKSCRISSPS